jgi:DNA polymerase elongation subunit (family B)
MWDFMAMIRAVKHKKIMPATCRAMGVAAEVGSMGSSKKDIAQSARGNASKEVMRVAKYGDEMPDWMEYPFLLYDQHTKSTAYHFPGGMTIKPDRDADSHFVPWYHVVVADVGAMYPTILKAVNAGADTVRLARKDEQPDDWVWLKKVPKNFLQLNVQTRNATEEFVDKGLMIGVIISSQPGLVNLAMSGILNVINKIKKEMKQASGEEQRRLSMMYQSLKGARNAGTHGILSAPRVSCRQFNLWGAALITTKGQQILADTLNILNDRGARVVYGDTDGIYVATSRSASPSLAQALAIDPPKESWIIQPKEALETIHYCNQKWRKELNYPEFELEPEEHEAMIFVKHKNYLIFDVKNGTVEMITKGNNFKGSDKPDIARMVLKDIMVDVLGENAAWETEEEARRNIKTSIKKITAKKVAELDIEGFDLDAFTLVQSVAPPGRYKPNPNGSDSVYCQRSKALEKLVGRIGTRRKFKFVITKQPLPGIPNPTKSGVKPIHYMYPVDLMQSRHQMDMDWYTDMIKNFIKGAFGLSALDLKEQYGLDAWM